MPAKPAPTSRESVGNLTVLVLALLSAIFAFQLNASMLSPVLATMQSELDTTAAQIGLTQTAFFASAALFSLFLPRWGDLIGRKRLMLGILAVNTVGCVISALSTNVGILTVGRVVQGISGPIVPMTLIMMHVQIPDNRRYAKYMAFLTAVNGGIAGIDALAGGWLAQNLGFQSVFWVMAIVSAIALIAVALGTTESRADDKVPMDWIGALFLVVLFGSLYFAFNQAGELADANWPLIGGLIVLAGVAFVIFWNVEKRTTHPLVTTDYMRERRTWALLLTTFLTMSGVFAVMNGLIPNLAQNTAIGPGLSAEIVSWWTLSPYAIAGLIIGPVAGQLAARLGYKLVLQAGNLVTVIGIAVVALFSGSATAVLVLLISIAIGITYAGISNIMLNGLGIVLSPRDNPGYLPGMNSAAFNLGAGFSFALLFAVFTIFNSSVGPVSGYRASLIAGGVVVLLALLTSFLIPKPAEHADSEPKTSGNRGLDDGQKEARHD